MTRRMVRADGTSAAVDVPITEEDQPDVFVSAFMVNDDRFYSGTMNVRVPPIERTLSIGITPSKQQFQPGEAATYDVLVKDAAGAPVKTKCSVNGLMLEPGVARRRVRTGTL